VIVDEAHHARRTLGNLAGTRFYRLVQQLANPEHANSRAMLFLTATPMQLHPFELYSLLELLDPTLFASYEDFDDHRRNLAGLNQTVEAIGRWPSLEARLRFGSPMRLDSGFHGRTAPCGQAERPGRARGAHGEPRAASDE
jgi:hypothetical protein